MKKRKIIIFVIIVIILLLLISYFGIKFWFLNYVYKQEVTGNKITIGEEISFSHKKIEDNSYFTIEELGIKLNILYDEFEEPNDLNNMYYFKINDEEPKALTINTIDYLIDVFSNDEYYKYNFDYFSKINKSKILNKNNIKNDFSLITYLSDVKDLSSLNLLSSMKDIKENYAKQYFIDMFFPNNTVFRKITGYYNGYLFTYQKEDNYTTTALVDINNKLYQFSFYGFNDLNYVIDFLETLEFEI